MLEQARLDAENQLSEAQKEARDQLTKAKQEGDEQAALVQETLANAKEEAERQIKELTSEW